jgi:hypothetical protein
VPHEGFPDWDEPTLLKTMQCMVLVGEMSLQQQVLQAVPENGVVLAPFETLAMPKALTDEVSLFNKEGGIFERM